MAKNDRILLDGILDDRVEKKLPSSQRDEVFEFLVFEQVLKDFDLSREELESGSVDGRDDGGVDGFFIIINGHLMAEASSFMWPRSGSELEVWILTCKHHDTFRQAPLDNLAATVSELLDFSIDEEDLRGQYSDLVLQSRRNLHLVYRKVSARLRTFRLKFIYASRGDANDVGESVKARSAQIQSIAQESFGDCQASFDFVGSTELVQLYRKIKNYSLELPFHEVLSRGERYLLLASLSDYASFVSESGALRRYLFDSNVRDFMGMNRVNEDIRETLADTQSPDFWWLNNGVTMLATSAKVVGKSIVMEDIQIVNGLQTTESIFRHFAAGLGDPEDRSVLVKVVVSTDDLVRDRIIRATNNQTDVELASLHATDKVQRDIEEILERHGFFYERRKNYYVNQGRLPSEIVTPMYIAAGYVSLVLKAPAKAAALRSRFMRSDELYRRVFSENSPIEIWPRIVWLLRTTDEVLEELRPVGYSERFLKRWRQLTCFLTVSKILGKFNFNREELIKMDIETYSRAEIEAAYEFIQNESHKNGSTKDWKSQAFALHVCREASLEFGIRGKIGPIDWPFYKSKHIASVDMDFALKVNALLPPQPWQIGAHLEVMRELGCTKVQVQAAIELLIQEGHRYYQKDGIVYDQSGNVVSFDAARIADDGEGAF